MSYLSKLDAAIEQLTCFLSSQSDEKQSCASFSTTQSKVPQVKPSGNLCPITGWSLDSISSMPIDPQTNKPISKNKLKSLKKKAAEDKKKEEKLRKREAEHQRILQEKLSKAVDELKECASLPPAVPHRVVDVFRLGESSECIPPRVELTGWVHSFRMQGKKLMFLELRDGTGVPPIIQCVLNGEELLNTKDVILLNREATISIKGKLVLRNVERSKDKRRFEVEVDWYKVIGSSDAEIENILNKDSNVEVSFDQRHWVLRRLDVALVMRMRCYITQALREHFFAKEFIEVSPPTLVQTQCEGGATLFKMDYYGVNTYLTQSSQLYLETCCASVGNVFCMLSSYRAEKSSTRRHLSEYTHVEGEMYFIDFEGLLDVLEDMVVDTVQRVIDNHGELLEQINPDFVAPKKPFLRMTHEEAIKYCNENGIYKDEEKKEKFQDGEDIPEGPERAMTDKINRPIFLTRFPADIKAFYMSRCSDRPDLTESVDLLMPGVGEIVGGSMRETDYEMLMKGYKSKEIDPTPYYWYTDLRKYGTAPHGGFGLGLERFLCWIMGIHHIRDVCLYPRYFGRCKP